MRQRIVAGAGFREDMVELGPKWALRIEHSVFSQLRMAFGQEVPNDSSEHKATTDKNEPRHEVA